MNVLSEIQSQKKFVFIKNLSLSSTPSITKEQLN